MIVKLKNAATLRDQGKRKLTDSGFKFDFNVYKRNGFNVYFLEVKIEN